jgi:hypothetical protein
MAGLADNYVYSDYVSDDGNTYSLRTISTWAAAALSGGTSTSTHPLYGRESRRRAPRKFRFVDASVPGRFVTLPVFTPTAYAAGVIGTSTFARGVRGEAAAVTFTLDQKIGEKVPSHTIKSSAAQFP